jgi:hypothetical protein
VRISERSWHLRFVRSFDKRDPVYGTVIKPYVPRDLCSYFWTVVGYLAFTALMLGVFVVFPLAALVWFVVKVVVPNWQIALVVLGVFAVGGLTIGLGYLLEWTVGRIWRRFRRTQVTDDGQPKNLFVAYVVAKKRRLCPRIEVMK